MWEASLRMNENDPNSTLIDGMKVIFHDVLKTIVETVRVKETQDKFQKQDKRIKFSLPKCKTLELSTTQCAKWLILLEMWYALIVSIYY